MKFVVGAKAALVVVVLLFGLLTGIQPASASSEATCDSGFGAKVPAASLVHGFDSNPGMWNEGGDASMRSVLGKLSGVEVVSAFDYGANHFDWVTNPNIGPKLAQTVDCLAQTSLRDGGAGKVIVVAHSMGGLAMRFAANQTVDGRKVADELGLVVTLGTPNTGAPLATVFGGGWHWYCGVLIGDGPNKDAEVKECEQSSAIAAMRWGSPELLSLPHFPSNVPVRAIAGNETVFAQLLFASISIPLDGDGVVPVSSATAEYGGSELGGGKFVFGCDVRHYDSYGPNTQFQGGQCWHNALYQTGYIQQSVVNGIRDYLASLSSVPTPDFTDFTPGKTIDLFGRLTIPAPKTWDLSFGKPDQFMNYSDQTSCNDLTAACPHIHFTNLTSSEAGTDMLETWSKVVCSAGQPGEVEGPTKVLLGGKQAEIYKQTCEGAEPVARYAWIIPSEKLYVDTDDGCHNEIVEGALERVVWRDN